MSQGIEVMRTAKPEEVIMPPPSIGFSIRLRQDDARRVMEMAKAHDWSVTKTIQKLVMAALDAKLVK